MSTSLRACIMARFLTGHGHVPSGTHLVYVENIMSERNGTLFKWIAITVLGILLYAKTLPDLISRWQTDPMVSHGPLVPLAALALVWINRERLSQTPRVPNWWGLLLIITAVVIHVLAVVTCLITLSHQTIPLFIAGVVLYLEGLPRLRVVVFPIAFLWFTVRLPQSLSIHLGLPLQLLASRTAGIVGTITGIPVVRDGIVLNLPNYRLLVAEACSGLSTLTALIALTTLIAYITPCRPVGKVVLLLASLPLALLANSLRVTVMLFIAWWWGAGAVEGFMHYGSGIILFLAALLPLIALGRFLSWRTPSACQS